MYNRTSMYEHSAKSGMCPGNIYSVYSCTLFGIALQTSKGHGVICFFVTITFKIKENTAHLALLCGLMSQT